MSKKQRNISIAIVIIAAVFYGAILTLLGIEFSMLTYAIGGFLVAILWSLSGVIFKKRNEKRNAE